MAPPSLELETTGRWKRIVPLRRLYRVGKSAAKNKEKEEKNKKNAVTWKRIVTLRRLYRVGKSSAKNKEKEKKNKQRANFCDKENFTEVTDHHMS